jgi:Tfp pilus assembly protein PilO
MTLAEFREQLQHPPKWVWGFLIAAVLGVASFLRSGELADRTAAANDLREASRKIQLQIRMAQGLEEQIATLEAGLVTARARLIKPEDRGEILRHFYGLAEAHRVELVDISILPTAAGPLLRTVPLQINVAGSFTDVLKFVRNIERGTYFFAPRDYMIQTSSGASTPSGSSPDPTRVTLSMTFELLAAR